MTREHLSEEIRRHYGTRALDDWEAECACGEGYEVWADHIAAVVMEFLNE